jgi:putative ABC transport system substrate-binding protein
MYQERTFIEHGGLMSYALNYCQHVGRAAAYVDKILKGEKPSNLPVEQPATFQFAVNLKAAKSIGVNLSPQILTFADEVIE